MTRCLLLASVLLASVVAFAFPSLQIQFTTHMEALGGPAWRAEGVDVALERRHGGEGGARIAIKRFKLPAPLPALDELDLECAELFLTEERFACGAGVLQFKPPRGKLAAGSLNFDFHPQEQTGSFELLDLPLAGGQITVRAELTAADWSVYLGATNADAAELAGLLGLPLDQVSGKGRLTLSARLIGQGATLNEVRMLATGRQLSFSAAGGVQAGENLSPRLEASWRPQAEGGAFVADLKLSSGQLYLDPVFLEFVKGAPLHLNVSGRHQGERLLIIDKLRWRQPGVLLSEAALTIDKGALKGADITIAEADFPAAYNYYLQPFLAAVGLGELETGGRIRGRLRFSGDALDRLELSLDDLSIDDAQDRFGLQALNGWLAWGRDASKRRSDLRWKGASVYRLGIGAGTLALEAQSGGLKLLHQTRIPVLDGSIIIDQLAVQDMGAANPNWDFAGQVAEISMERLSAALGWPPLAGAISGVIPAVRYVDHRLAVGGALRIRIFQGEIVITHLRLEDPFGLTPILLADLDVRDLDLAAVTRTFDFGRIEGRLGGEVRDLRLENWHPVQFKARLATPEDDRSPHRISQRAVQNLSALSGGGASAALGRGFIGVFDEFNYRRLGLSCHLENGVCEMNGVAPAKQGYYIVEGAGLPRIDVIGYNRRVDWQELLARLKAAAEAEAPVVR